MTTVLTCDVAGVLAKKAWHSGDGVSKAYQWQRKAAWRGVL